MTDAAQKGRRDNSQDDDKGKPYKPVYQTSEQSVQTEARILGRQARGTEVLCMLKKKNKTTKQIKNKAISKLRENIIKVVKERK